MKRLSRILSFWLPGWDGWSFRQRVASVDFGVSVCLLLFASCSDSVLLTLVFVLNMFRSWRRLRRSGIEIGE